MRGLRKLGEIIERMKRIYHTWDEWECYPAGFYENRPPRGMTPKDATHAYTEFLRDLPRFERALKRVITEWKNSCEHYLSNESMNRIAWLGQAAMCIDTGIPATFRSGFSRLSSTEQQLANEMALKYLNEWMRQYNEPELTFETAKSKTQADMY